MKVIIELEFDTYTPTTKDIIDFIDELKERNKNESKRFIRNTRNNR